MKQTDALTTNQDLESLAQLNNIMQQAGQAAYEQVTRVANEGTARVKSA